LLTPCASAIFATSSAVFIAEVPNDLILGVHGMATEPCHYRVIA